MRLRDGTNAVLSPSDLAAFSRCEWGYVRWVEGILGIAEPPPEEDDPMLQATAQRGLAHEAAVLETLRASHKDVVEIADPRQMPGDIWENLESVSRDTLNALQERRPVIFQAAFLSDSFSGFADFLVWDAKGFYQVIDSKLARSAKVSALLQLAAYAGELRRLQVPVGPEVSLWLGSGEVSTHTLADIEPIYRLRMSRLRQVVDGIVNRPASEKTPVRWEDSPYAFCGSCGACQQAITRHDDLLQVADMRRSQRSKITAAGIRTLDSFATFEGAIPDLNPRVQGNLQAQARAQLQSRQTRDGLFFEFDRPDGLLAIPDPSDGDIFFDFEGDPLYTEGQEHGLDYLFGWVSADEGFSWLWADSLAEEKIALEEFVDRVMVVKAKYPDMHVYHYASYEQTHLLQLAQRHGTREEKVDELVRDQVLVNLLPVVKNSLRLGLPSYSIKYLEKAYLSSVRGGGVTTAVDSVIDYHLYRDDLATGKEVEAERRRKNILAYNETDCISTLELRDWLLERRPGPHVPPSQKADDTRSDEEPDSVRDELRALVADVSFSTATANEKAIFLAAEAVDYHRREHRTFWWGHFRRLSEAMHEWQDERGVIVARHVSVVQDWQHKRTWSYRRLAITGDFAPGTTLKSGESPHLLYETPSPGPLVNPSNPLARGVGPKSRVISAGDGYVEIEEGARSDGGLWNAVPSALAPPAPPRDNAIRQAIRQWATQILESLPDKMPDDPAMDILRRVGPRGTITSPDEGVSAADAIFDTVRRLKNSYLAVQGPPGTGKTFNAAEVIRRLVLNGYKVGVVAQSHAAIENLLRKCAAIGLPREQIGKKLGSGQHGVTHDPWTPLADIPAVAEFAQKPGGRVIGGTVWTFCNENAFSKKSLHVIVIEEAGQYSLANTIAVSTVAESLLLLGDPQQLSEVSQGAHPVPVDTSALAWLSAGHDVLPAEQGIFLDRSFRMHPELCRVVSNLSYEGKLTAVENETRQSDGIEPGLHVRPVVHDGNSVESLEEAREVVRIVEEVSPHSWTDDGKTRALRDGPGGIIVVAPYNAQVNLIRHELDAAGLGFVRVGTVDKFQGQEAPIAILSMSASSLQEVPRGIDFLLDRNRINVALSRAQWASFLVFSPGLLDFLPTTPEGLALLSRFAGIVERNNAGQLAGQTIGSDS